jgi:hypothetical protein
MTAACCEDWGRLFQTDAEAVCFAASLLDISEFRLFEIAHVNWFGSKAPKKAMEGFFGNYLHSGLVPFWLRHMVRSIINKHWKGNLAAREFGIEQPHVSPSEKRVGWLVIGLLSVLVFALGWVSSTVGPQWWP